MIAVHAIVAQQRGPVQAQSERGHARSQMPGCGAVGSTNKRSGRSPQREPVHAELSARVRALGFRVRV